MQVPLVGTPDYYTFWAYKSKCATLPTGEGLRNNCESANLERQGEGNLFYYYNLKDSHLECVVCQPKATSAGIVAVGFEASTVSNDGTDTNAELVQVLFRIV